MWVSQNGWLIMENPKSKWMIWEYPHFWTPPYAFIFVSIKLIGGLSHGL